VSFSGGIDSSLVLAAAVRLARRLGLDDPVPITWRFKDAPRADESDWQERVVAEVGVRDWERIEVDDELDFVGPHAQAVLRRHGVLYPANTYVHAPLLERARGGALLTGVGGDQVLGLGRWRQAARALSGAIRPTARDAAHVALAVSPSPLRRLFDPRRNRLASPWLWPDVEREVASRHAAARTAEPVWWSARVAWQSRRRDVRLGAAALELVAEDAGARLVQPLLDSGFMAAVARAGGRRGFGSRLAAVAAMFGDVAPRAVLQRSAKARLDQAFWRSGSQKLARAWGGGDVDPALVDVEALKAIWRTDPPALRTATLLQQVWVSTMKP
jgi:asparagine synthase (glutamine-hydrolysing)